MAMMVMSEPMFEPIDHLSESSPHAWLLSVTEPTRAAFECGSLVAAALPLWRVLANGDGHPVLVLPGFLAGDGSTRPLRRILRRLGYQVHSWHLGRNLGPTDAVLTGMTHRLRELHTRHDATVSLIGWSLGGIYARGLARRYPSLVRQVITLGSPFRPVRASVTRLAQTGRESAELAPEYGASALPVPATSIYSRYDGVVAWRACLEESSASAENIAVIGSHLGLGYHPAAIWAIADRLAQPADNWAKFRPPAMLRLLFPPPGIPQHAVAKNAANYRWFPSRPGILPTDTQGNRPTKTGRCRQDLPQRQPRQCRPEPETGPSASHQACPRIDGSRC